MQKYAICEISGKQYKIIPNVPFLTDWLDDEKKLAVPAMLLAEEGKVNVGKPVLEQIIELTVLGDEQGEKVRVAKFHAKANYRRVTGIRPKHSKVVWSVKSA